MENTGIVATMIAPIVGELTAFNPKVSPMKYMKGSQNTSIRNHGISFLSIFCNCLRKMETVDRIIAARLNLMKIIVKTGIWF